MALSAGWSWKQGSPPHQPLVARTRLRELKARVNKPPTHAPQEANPIHIVSPVTAQLPTLPQPKCFSEEPRTLVGVWITVWQPNMQMPKSQPCCLCLAHHKGRFFVVRASSTSQHALPHTEHLSASTSSQLNQSSLWVTASFTCLVTEALLSVLASPVYTVRFVPQTEGTD